MDFGKSDARLYLISWEQCPSDAPHASAAAQHLIIGLGHRPSERRAMALTDSDRSGLLALLPSPDAWRGGLVSDEFLDTIVALFTTYDHRARMDLDQELGPRDLDTEIFYDLLEGPAAPYIDRSRSSVDDQIIAFADGSAARRRPDGDWERISLDQTSLFDDTVEIRLDLHDLG